jgi:hypothetical protein
MNNPRIVLVIKPFEEFYNYRYHKHWIENHEKNHLLKDRIDWKVNMLWCEKVHFVYETMQKSYFNTDFYGWCDIGYFRCTETDLTKTELYTWCADKIQMLQHDTIYYAMVNNDQNYVNYLFSIIQNKNEYDLPRQPIPPSQFSIAGGFFISHKNNIEWWRNTYDARLALYFKHNYLVKDDQMIVVDCVFSDISRFSLCCENNPKYDNWFMFQRLLL